MASKITVPTGDDLTSVTADAPHPEPGRHSGPAIERDAGAIGGQSGSVFHSLFRLGDGVAEAEFLTGCEAFYRHLIAAGFARGYRIMRRQSLEVFGKTLPGFEYHAELDLEHDRACYEYVKINKEPVRSLHRTMNSKVERGSADFFLTACVAEGG